MTRVVISQPMLFPWVGLFEQVRLADIYVHYTDVQFSRGSFVNRVQVKTAEGMTWLTVPLKDLRLGQLIKDVQIDNATDWRSKHLALLGRAYVAAPFYSEMLALVRRVYDSDFTSVSDLVVRSMEVAGDYFGLFEGRQFLDSKHLGIPGSGSSRVLSIVKQLHGDVYITGHGARRYLEHEAFEATGISVEYMEYRKTAYPQLHGPFTPFVTVLDLVANAGREGKSVISSGAINWKSFIT